MPDLRLTPRRPWLDKHVVLGVTGGIAAYKSIQVARDLTRLGARVDAVLTHSAQKFVAPLSFEGVTGRPALTDLFSVEGAALHIRLGRGTDVVCIARPLPIFWRASPRAAPTTSFVRRCSRPGRRSSFVRR